MKLFIMILPILPFDFCQCSDDALWSTTWLDFKSACLSHLLSDWSNKKELSLAFVPLAVSRVSLPAFLKSSPPSKKLVCGFHWLWHRNALTCRLGCWRYVPMWGIMLAVALLVSCNTEPLKPPRCRFKAPQAVSDWPDDAVMWSDRWG